MTFLASSLNTGPGKSHKEYNLENYHPDAEFYVSATRYPLRKPKETDTIRIRASLPSPHGQIRIQFETVDGKCWCFLAPLFLLVYRRNV